EFFCLRPVNGGFISEIVERDQVVISEERHDFRDSVFFQFNLILSDKTVRLDEFPAEFLLDLVHHRTRPRFLLRSFGFRRSSRFRAGRWRRRFGNGGFGFSCFGFSGFWFGGLGLRCRRGRRFHWFSRFFRLLAIFRFVCHLPSRKD